MEELRLVRPSIGHKRQYQEMMDEWESFGGRLNPGALRRYSHRQQKNVTYEEWLEWIEADRKAGQNLYFFMQGTAIMGAISIRRRCEEVDGHSGYGIRPSPGRPGWWDKRRRNPPRCPPPTAYWYSRCCPPGAGFP